MALVSVLTDIPGLIPLGALRPGQRGRIGEVFGSSDQVRRLEEMGVRDGATVEMIRSGNPCIVRLAGHRLCFRGGELLNVLVLPAGRDESVA